MNTYLVQGLPDRALAVANVQIAKTPNNSVAYDLLGSLLRSKKDLTGAEAAFGRAISLDAKNYDALIKLVQVQSAKGEIDRAIATCQQAIKDHPRMPEFYTLLGELYGSKQNWSEARNAYQEARNLQPNDPIATRNLADVLLQSGGNLDDALSLAQAAQRSMTDSPAAADTLGWVYYQKGEYPLALSLFEQALKLQQKRDLPDSPDIHYHLGLAYQKTEHPALARQHLEHVLKIDPNYRAAADIRKQLSTSKS
jgi:tetratricopeptide (TPR) repeat protein